MNEFTVSKLRHGLMPFSALFLCAILYLIWPTVHTIALRKVLLLAAAGIGFLLWYRSDDRNAILKSPWLIYLGLLLAWVLFHAGFISQNGSEAWREIVSQWLWPYMAVLAGIGLALAGRSYDQSAFIKYLLIVMLIQPVFFLLDRFDRSLELGYWVTNFELGMLGTDLKTSLTFSSDMLAALSCAKILENYRSGVPLTRSYMWISMIILALLVAIFSSSFNSILLIISSIILMLLLLVFRLKTKLNVKYIWIVFLIAMMSIYAASLSHAVRHKSSVMISNLKVALDIEGHLNWTNYSKFGLPINDMGEQVPESFYLRAAYAQSGIFTVLGNPLGYGVTRKAYESLVQKKYPEASIANAHNSYLNLSCAVGIPGLLLFILFLVSIFRQLYKANSNLAHPAMWMIGMYAVHWATDALERDHFFESYLFVIALLMTLTMNKIPQKSHD